MEALEATVAIGRLERFAADYERAMDAARTALRLGGDIVSDAATVILAMGQGRIAAKPT